MKNVLLKTLLWLGVGFAALIAGMVLYENFSWARQTANLALFFEDLTSGDSERVFGALISGKAMMVFIAVSLCIGLAWDSWRRRHRD